MSLQKYLALALASVLCLGLVAAPAAAQEAEILWLPEEVRFASELGYVYVPELDWLSVSLDEDGFVPALYDMGTGTLVEEFDDMGPFSEGLAGVSKDGKDGYIDRTGQVVVPLVWDVARDFHDGVAVAMLERPYAPPYAEYTYLDYYLIDPTGAIVAHLGPEYGDVSDFHGGVAYVWDYHTDLTWYIDTQGRVVEPPEDTSVFDSSYDYDRFNLAVEWQGDKCGLVDKDGTVVIPYEYDYASWITEGPDHQPGRYWYVQKGDRFGLVKDPAWQDTPPVIPWGTWGATAYPSTQTVEVDGKAVEFQMYALKDENGNDTNYIKLRDLAAVLNSFDVGWNGKNVLVKPASPTPPTVRRATRHTAGPRTA